MTLEGQIGTTTFLLCRVQSRLCAIPVEHVVETMRPLPIEPLVGAPPFVQGLSVIRGEAVPIVSASQLLGDAHSRPGRPSRLIVVKIKDRRVGLAVDEVVATRVLSGHALRDLPPLLQEAPSDVVSAIGVLDADLLLVLESSHLVPESLWTALDAPGAIG